MKLTNLWPRAGFVTARAQTADLTIVVLKVSPALSCRVGFVSGTTMQYLHEPINPADGMFGMRIGNDTTNFFVLPEDMLTDVTLEIVGYTSPGDPRYETLPVY